MDFQDFIQRVLRFSTHLMEMSLYTIPEQVREDHYTWTNKDGEEIIEVLDNWYHAIAEQGEKFHHLMENVLPLVEDDPNKVLTLALNEVTYFSALIGPTIVGLAALHGDNYPKEQMEEIQNKLRSIR